MKSTSVLGPLLSPILFLFGSAAVSCGPDGQAGQDLVVRDSGSVRIVENQGPKWGLQQGWEVSEAPLLTIGDGLDEDLSLHVVRGAERLSNGNFLVGNHGSLQVLILDERGRKVRAIGREGEGPGEFKAIHFAQSFRSDSLLVWDYNLGRGSVFSLEGEFGRTIRLPQMAFGRPQPGPIGAFSDGVLLAQSPSDANQLERGYFSYHYLTFTPEGEPISEIGEFPSVSCAKETSCHVGWFGSIAALAYADVHFYHGFPIEYEIRKYHREGELEAIIRREKGSVPITQLVIDEYMGYVLENSPDLTEDQFREGLNNQDVPSEMPQFASNMVVDELGNVWIREYEEASPTFHPFRDVERWYRGETAPWGVFDADGIYLGRVRMPSRLVVEEIGGDFVLGVYTDELGVETVRVYALDRS